MVDEGIVFIQPLTNFCFVVTLARNFNWSTRMVWSIIHHNGRIVRLYWAISFLAAIFQNCNYPYPDGSQSCQILWSSTLEVHLEPILYLIQGGQYNRSFLTANRGFRHCVNSTISPNSIDCLTYIIPSSIQINQFFLLFFSLFDFSKIGTPPFPYSVLFHQDFSVSVIFFSQRNPTFFINSHSTFLP